MPLKPGSSRRVVSENISEMVHSGYPQKQAVAASLSNARRHPGYAEGGIVEHDQDRDLPPLEDDARLDQIQYPPEYLKTIELLLQNQRRMQGLDRYIPGVDPPYMESYHQRTHQRPQPVPQTEAKGRADGGGDEAPSNFFYRRDHEREAEPPRTAPLKPRPWGQPRMRRRPGAVDGIEEIWDVSQTGRQMPRKLDDGGGSDGGGTGGGQGGEGGACGGCGGSGCAGCGCSGDACGGGACGACSCGGACSGAGGFATGSTGAGAGAGGGSGCGGSAGSTAGGSEGVGAASGLGAGMGAGFGAAAGVGAEGETGDVGDASGGRGGLGTTAAAAMGALGATTGGFFGAEAGGRGATTGQVGDVGNVGSLGLGAFGPGAAAGCHAVGGGPTAAEAYAGGPFSAGALGTAHGAETGGFFGANAGLGYGGTGLAGTGAFGAEGDAGGGGTSGIGNAGASFGAGFGGTSGYASSGTTVSAGLGGGPGEDDGGGRGGGQDDGGGRGGGGGRSGGVSPGAAVNSNDLGIAADMATAALSGGSMTGIGGPGGGGWGTGETGVGNQGAAAVGALGGFGGVSDTAASTAGGSDTAGTGGTDTAAAAADEAAPAATDVAAAATADQDASPDDETTGHGGGRGGGTSKGDTAPAVTGDISTSPTVGGPTGGGMTVTGDLAEAPTPGLAETPTPGALSPIGGGLSPTGGLSGGNVGYGNVGSFASPSTMGAEPQGFSPAALGAVVDQDQPQDQPVISNTYEVLGDRDITPGGGDFGGRGTTGSWGDQQSQSQSQSLLGGLIGTAQAAPPGERSAPTFGPQTDPFSTMETTPTTPDPGFEAPASDRATVTNAPLGSINDLGPTADIGDQLATDIAAQQSESEKTDSRTGASRGWGGPEQAGTKDAFIGGPAAPGGWQGADPLAGAIESQGQPTQGGFGGRGATGSWGDRSSSLGGLGLVSSANAQGLEGIDAATPGLGMGPGAAGAAATTTGGLTGGPAAPAADVADALAGAIESQGYQSEQDVAPDARGALSGLFGVSDRQGGLFGGPTPSLGSFLGSQAQAQTLGIDKSQWGDQTPAPGVGKDESTLDQTSVQSQTPGVVGTGQPGGYMGGHEAIGDPSYGQTTTANPALAAGLADVTSLTGALESQGWGYDPSVAAMTDQQGGKGDKGTVTADRGVAPGVASPSLAATDMSFDPGSLATVGGIESQGYDPSVSYATIAAAAPPAAEVAAEPAAEVTEDRSTVTPGLAAPPAAEVTQDIPGLAQEVTPAQEVADRFGGPWSTTQLGDRSTVTASPGWSPGPAAETPTVGPAGPTPTSIGQDFSDLAEVGPAALAMNQADIDEAHAAAQAQQTALEQQSTQSKSATPSWATNLSTQTLGQPGKGDFDQPSPAQAAQAAQDRAAAIDKAVSDQNFATGWEGMFGGITPAEPGPPPSNVDVDRTGKSDRDTDRDLTPLSERAAPVTPVTQTPLPSLANPVFGGRHGGREALTDILSGKTTPTQTPQVANPPVDMTWETEPPQVNPTTFVSKDRTQTPVVTEPPPPPEVVPTPTPDPRDRSRTAQPAPPGERTGTRAGTTPGERAGPAAPAAPVGGLVGGPSPGGLGGRTGAGMSVSEMGNEYLPAQMQQEVKRNPSDVARMMTDNKQIAGLIQQLLTPQQQDAVFSELGFARKDQNPGQPEPDNKNPTITVQGAQQPGLGAGYADGGFVTQPGYYAAGGLGISQMAGQAARAHYSGSNIKPALKPPGVHLVSSSVPGRTDRIPMRAKPGSFVLPADVVSGMGQGNTTAGAKMWGDAIAASIGPAGVHNAIRRQSLRAPPMRGFGGSKGMAEGGEVDHDELTPIIIAGGEAVVDPEIVCEMGGGDNDLGKKALMQAVLTVRKNTIARLKGLPKPVN